MLGYIFFTFWRLFQIVTLIPTLGMLVSLDITESIIRRLS